MAPLNEDDPGYMQSVIHQLGLAEERIHARDQGGLRAQRCRNPGAQKKLRAASLESGAVTAEVWDSNFGSP